jgi:Tfp pilus assembly protein FimV
MDTSPNVQGIIVGDHGSAIANKMIGVSTTTINYAAGPEEHGEPQSVEQFRQQLEALLQTLDERREDIPVDVVDTTKAAVEETASDQPRKGVVVALLKHIASGVEAIVDLAAAVAPLVRAAGKLFQ